MTSPYRAGYETAFAEAVDAAARGGPRALQVVWVLFGELEGRLSQEDFFRLAVRLAVLPARRGDDGAGLWSKVGGERAQC